MRDTGPGHPKSRKGQMLDSLEERRKKGSSPMSASLAGLGAAEWVGDLLQLVCQALPSQQCLDEGFKVLGKLQVCEGQMA